MGQDMGGRDRAKVCKVVVKFCEQIRERVDKAILERRPAALPSAGTVSPR